MPEYQIICDMPASELNIRKPCEPGSDPTLPISLGCRLCDKNPDAGKFGINPEPYLSILGPDGKSHIDLYVPWKVSMFNKTSVHRPLTMPDDACMLTDKPPKQDWYMINANAEIGIFDIQVKSRVVTPIDQTITADVTIRISDTKSSLNLDLTETSFAACLRNVELALHRLGIAAYPVAMPEKEDA